MKAAANARFLSRRQTGVERYGQEILRRLEPGLRPIAYPAGLPGTFGHLWEQFRLPGLLQPNEVLWSPANTGPLAVGNQVLSLHDLAALENPQWYTRGFAAWYRLLIPLLVRRVRRVVAPSQFVANKIQKRFGLPASRVTVVGGGVDCQRFHPQAARLPRLPARYILFVGSLQPRKNLPALLRAWETLCSAELLGFSELYLVIAGETGRAFRREGWPRLPERVLLLGYVPETDLPGLYAGAEVFVLPAWDEGFGLTILEAMACGTAVIASQRGALPEVSGGAALLFDPSLPSALLAVLEQVLTEPGVRAGLVEKGLRRSANSGWEQPAQDLWRVIQACQ